MPAKVTLRHFACLPPRSQTLSCAPGYTGSGTATCDAAGTAWVVTNNCVPSTIGTGSCPMQSTAQITTGTIVAGTGAPAYTGLLADLSLSAAYGQATAAAAAGVTYTTTAGQVSAVGEPGNDEV